jgi:hypothetical protein
VRKHALEVRLGIEFHSHPDDGIGRGQAEAGLDLVKQPAAFPRVRRGPVRHPAHVVSDLNQLGHAFRIQLLQGLVADEAEAVTVERRKAFSCLRRRRLPFFAGGHATSVRVQRLEAIHHRGLRDRQAAKKHTKPTDHRIDGAVEFLSHRHFPCSVPL